MKLNLFILLILASSITFSASKSAYDYEVVEKKGVLYLKKDNSPFTGKVILKKDRNFYVNGKPQGKWLTFYK